MLRVLLIAASFCACTLFTACTAIDRPIMSGFSQTSDKTFAFTATFDAIYPRTGHGERQRQQWLELYLDEYGMCPAGYTILERRVEVYQQAFGGVGKIYYEGQCQDVT